PISILHINIYDTYDTILSLNPKIFVVAAVAVLAVIVGVVAFSGSSIISDVSDTGTFFPSTEQTQRDVLPLEIELENLSIIEVTDTAATLEIVFKASNPNSKPVILQLVKYDIYENGVKIKTGQIGERAEGMVTGSNYFTILNEQPTILRDKITIKNSGNTPELWSALMSNTPQWQVKGEAFFNLSSMLSGGENQITFEFP
ncbi:MAG: hypothetical protein AABW62_01515, partial [Thermoproteota archaeon]